MDQSLAYRSKRECGLGSLLEQSKEGSKSSAEEVQVVLVEAAGTHNLAEE